MSNKEIFTRYYENNTWGGKESVSGPGSDTDTTQQLAKELSVLLKQLGIKTFLDAPCGDFNWMKNVDLRNIKYSGTDIVEDLIAKNIEKYSSEDVEFFVMDIVEDTFKTYDLIMIRDTLVHLTNKQVASVLKKVKESGTKYLLTTHHSWIDDSIFPEHNRNNRDIKTGQWRRINLLEPPFFLPKPIRVIVEGNTNSKDLDKSLALYLVEDIPDSFAQIPNWFVN